ncbi:MAG: prohibitin family protein [Lachnospiraceae bacterium]|nr:prohibitin family protein [Lachnospiraceae bacterium]
MMMTALALVLLLGGIVTGIVMKQTSGSKKARLPVILGIVGAVVALAGGCFTSVPTGHTGVVTTFGKVENYTLDAGIHGKLPWQEVVLLDNRVQKARVELNCFSSDIQEVKVIYTVNYQISKENAMTIYSNIGTLYYDTVITPNVSESVKVMTARYTAENLVSSRDELSEKIEDLLSTQLARYNIVVVGTSIEDMDFTDAFTNAVEAKQVAAQNKLQAEIEQQQKIMEQRSSAERAVIDANAAAEVARIQAEADLAVTKIQADAAEYAGQKEAAKNKAIAENLTKDLLNYYYVQQWNGILPNYYVGSDNVSTIIGLGNDAQAVPAE